jgi:hypothetical protein
MKPLGPLGVLLIGAIVFVVFALGGFIKYRVIPWYRDKTRK